MLSKKLQFEKKLNNVSEDTNLGFKLSYYVPIKNIFLVKEYTKKYWF